MPSSHFDPAILVSSLAMYGLISLIPYEPGPVA